MLIGWFTKNPAMNKQMFLLAALVGLLACINGCSNNNSNEQATIAGDSASITRGEASFNKNCRGCHNFKQDGIGPQLSGVTVSNKASWLLSFIKNSQRLVASGDTGALAVFNKYKKAVMPSFETLPEDELQSLLAFLHTHKKIIKTPVKNGMEITNPFPQPVAVSPLVVNLQLLTQFPVSAEKSPFTRITAMEVQPGTGRLFVNDLQGKLYAMEGNKPVVYLDMQQQKAAFINKPGLGSGLGSVAFHPAFASNGLFYTTHSEAPGSAKADFGYADSIRVSLQWVLTEWKATSPGAASFTGTSRELLRINMVNVIHGIQEISFNPLAKPGSPDYGLLYIGVGDGGSAEEGYASLVHSKDKPWGSILRIDPTGNNSRNGKYGIPAGNPFVNSGLPPGTGEVYAYGFRNPHRFSWTSKGQLFASNIGQANIESINLVLPGHDYGWPIREGNFVFGGINGNLGNVYPLPADDSTYHITYPVAEYDHDEGKAITGGYEYTGRAVPLLQGKFLFGDIPSGRLFYTNIAEMVKGKQAAIHEWRVAIDGKTDSLVQLCGSKRVDLHFGRDAKGEMYILTKADGKLYRLSGASMKAVTAAKQ
jgi:glucose/arabinose dehydrogenase/cytochrome c2